MSTIIHLSRSLVVALVLTAGVPALAQTPTWSDDIACIVHSHCTPCHRSDGPGHFDLVTYADAYYWRNEMVAATQSRFMPPWPPDPNYRSLAHERVLSQGEIDLIAAWVAGNAPEGDPQNTPAPPTFSGAAQLAQPDLTAIMEDFVIPPSTNDLYRCFVLDADIPVDRYITAMEVLPGNTSMVHHVLVFQDTTGQARLLDQADPAPGYTSFGGIGVNEAKLIGAWVPGEQPFVTPPGMGIRLYAGADIVIQVHYPATSSVEVDTTRINMLLSSEPFLRPLSIDPVLEHTWSLTDGPLVIAPNQVRSFHNQFQVPFPVTISSIAPHAHLVCTSMKSYAVTPAGDTIPLIDIPNWDFRWQGHYAFRNPIYLPQGTMLHGHATYDNTANNPFNPNNPPQWVFLGEATTNEMMLFYFAWTVGLPTDVSIVVDDSDHLEHHLDCVPGLLTGVADRTDDALFMVHPVPATEQLRVTVGAEPVDLLLRDATGRLLMQRRQVQGTVVLDVATLARGLHFMEFRSRSGRVVHRKLVLE
jgi:hypothetical protein